MEQAINKWANKVKVQAQKEMDQVAESYECPICEEMTTDITGSGTCKACEAKGIWMDPLGGVHISEPGYDPADMYK